MTKKEEIKNKWFMRNDISLREAWNNILDEYAKYVAEKAFSAGFDCAVDDIAPDWNVWFEQFKAKENEQK
jgi:hypothetical protein